MAEQDILASGGGAFNNQLMQNAGQGPAFGVNSLRNLTSLPAVRSALPALALIAALGLAALTYFVLSTPAQRPLFQGLADADKAAVAEALQASGIEYSLDPPRVSYLSMRLRFTKRACYLPDKAYLQPSRLATH